MTSLLRLLPTLLLLLLRGARRTAPPASAGAAPLNFVNFSHGAPAAAADEHMPDGFVAHDWADRADPQEGRL